MRLLIDKKLLESLYFSIPRRRIILHWLILTAVSIYQFAPIDSVAVFYLKLRAFEFLAGKRSYDGTIKIYFESSSHLLYGIVISHKTLTYFKTEGKHKDF